MPHKKGHSWGDLGKDIKKKAKNIGAGFDKKVESLKILKGTKIHSDATERNTQRMVDATKNTPAGTARTSSGKKVFSDKERGQLIRRSKLFKSDRKTYNKIKSEHDKRQEEKRKKVASDRHKTFKEDRKIKDKSKKSFNKGRDKKDHVSSAYERRQKDADKAMRDAARKRHEAWKASRANKKNKKK